MKKRIPIVILAFVLLAVQLCGCGVMAAKNQSYAETGSYAEEMNTEAAMASGYWAAESEATAEDTMSQPPVPQPEQQPAQTNPAKLIYTADLDMETLDFPEAVKALAALTAECGGYYESSSISDQGSTQRAYFTVRVPAENYRTFVDSAGELCHLLSAQEYTEDVSEVYYDTEGHLRTQQIKLERLQALLEEAVKMEDIITIESAISETEEIIENYSGTLRHYDALVDYSTVSISLREVKVYEPEPPESFGSRMGTAFKDGWRGFVNGIENIAVALAYSWLWLVLIAAVAVGIVALVKHHRNVRPEKTGKGRRSRKSKKHSNTEEPVYSQPGSAEQENTKTEE